MYVIEPLCLLILLQILAFLQTSVVAWAHVSWNSRAWICPHSPRNCSQSLLQPSREQLLWYRKRVLPAGSLHYLFWSLVSPCTRLPFEIPCFKVCLDSTFRKFVQSYFFIPSVYVYKMLQVCSQCTHLVLYIKLQNRNILFQQDTWLIKRLDILCAYMCSFCRPSYISIHTQLYIYK